MGAAFGKGVAAIDYGQLIQSVEDVAPEYAEMAEKIGVGALLKLCEHYGGSRVYVPATYTLARHSLTDAIMRDYKNGESVGDIARKFAISERTVYNSLAGAMEKLRKAPIPGQVSLFDGG